jgi:hypothetical protein
MATNGRKRDGSGYEGVEFASACGGQLEEPYVVLSNRKDSVTKWRYKQPRCAQLAAMHYTWQIKVRKVKVKLVGTQSMILT